MPRMIAGLAETTNPGFLRGLLGTAQMINEHLVGDPVGAELARDSVGPVSIDVG
ncbi:hypothetical protein D3C76_1826010 [compost metagenome]